MNELISLREAATVLGTHYERVWKLCKKGAIPPGVVVRLGGRLLINRPRLDEWISAGGNSKATAREEAPCAQ
ncbi:MAG: helix-turn-helix domain-containing protein [Bryobacterales bacterium]|nr:helix-turn-helix domain-containing protein [Bryobacterales bacterium]